MKKIIRAFLFVAAFALLFYSGYRIYDYARQQKNVTQIVEEAKKDAVVHVHTEEDFHLETVPLTVDFQKLWEKNGDIVAWLYCENTKIDYPVVQSGDNAYYLRRLLDGSYNIAGTLFLDYRCASDFSDFNSVIYGHNMRNDTMFGPLPEYKNQAFYDEHPVWWIFTPEKSFRIDLMWGYVTPSDSETYQTPVTDEEKEEFIRTAAASSTFRADKDYSADDTFLTLSTCSYEYENARYVLVGKLTEIK